MEMLAIRAEGITRRFGAFTALDDVRFELKTGEIHCLAGENGSGKSTLIKVMTGVYQAEVGARFEFGSAPPAIRILPSDAKRLGIHVIWQDLALFPHLTVGENIVFDRYVAHPFAPVDPKQAIREASETIARLGVALDPAEKVERLNIAKRQLVAICRVLRADARIVFMDEPTASLTRKETDALLAIVRKLSEAGISVVFVSHRLAEVLDVSERVTVLRDGRLVGTYPTEGMTQRKLSALMTGMEGDQRQRNVTEFGPTALEVRNLSRNGEFSDISFRLRAGEILAFAGLLGSGRTEIAHSLFGMTRPDSGEIFVAGRAVSFSSNRDAIANGIAYVSEDRLNLGLVQAQSIVKNTAITVLDRLAKPAFFLAPKKLRQLCRDWVTRLKTKVSDPDLPVSSLSGGNQQRVVLAKWLATNPKILILDAPTVGVDVGAKAGIFEIIRGLAAQGMAIILISDEANEIITHADRILVLRLGRLAMELSPAETSEHALEGIVNA